jgi:hypothetical protein
MESLQQAQQELTVVLDLISTVCDIRTRRLL